MSGPQRNLILIADDGFKLLLRQGLQLDKKSSLKCNKGSVLNVIKEREVPHNRNKKATEKGVVKILMSKIGLYMKGGHVFTIQASLCVL